MRNEFAGPLAALVIGFATATGAAAATLNEADLTGGSFAGHWSAPTAIGSGFDTIRGTGRQNVFDNLVFTGLPSGAQTLTFRFWAPEGIDHSYSAGGSILVSHQPFRWDWDGTTAGSVQVDYYTPSRDFALDLGDSFSGNLYLALNFTHGSSLNYAISAPSNGGSPAPVPLPAGALLIVSGIAALGLAGRRRRAATA